MAAKTQRKAPKEAEIAFLPELVSGSDALGEEEGRR
jgi:hypothetical protein